MPPAKEPPMRLPFWSGLLAVLLCVPSMGAARAQTSAGPWQDCDFPATGVTIESGALLPGLEQGRRVSALCFAHAIRGSALTAGQVRLESLSPPLARGDLVEFRRPDDTSKTAIRRVIGLPGDRLQLREYRVLLNDNLLAMVRVAEMTIFDAQGERVRAVRMHETMSRGILGYDVLLPPDATDGSGTSPPFTVPARTIYVLPDNRAAAEAINKPESGFVPVVNLIALLQVPPSR
jgi:signal peptidase I